MEEETISGARRYHCISSATLHRCTMSPNRPSPTEFRQLLTRNTAVMSMLRSVPSGAWLLHAT